MSSADLYEDGFPHGTKEGYDRGCRGAACPEGLEGHQTCATAKSRYNGDYGYRKLVDAGLTPEQIRDAEKPAEPAKPLHLVKVPKLAEGGIVAKPVARAKPPAPTPVAADLEQWPEPEPETPNATDLGYTVDPKTGKTIPLEVHGTPKGYWNGCRDINCPGVDRVGKSCRAAINEYSADKRRERIELAKQATATSEPEEPADDVAPELTDNELAHVTAFGLNEPEQETPALAEPEAEPALDEHVLAAATRLRDEKMRELREIEQQLGLPPYTPADHSEQIRVRDADLRHAHEKIRELENVVHWYEQLTEQRQELAEQQRVVVPTDGGRTVTITIVVGS